MSHHRLLAIVACYPSGMPLDVVLDDLGGKDVHHESGVEWDNRPGNLTVLDHGRHSSVTQAQVRAWAADAKDTIENETLVDAGVRACGRCGVSGDEETLAESPDWQGYRCLACARQESSGSEIRVV